MKNILFILVALLLVQEATAQQGLYFRFNTGFGVAANGDVLGIEQQTDATNGEVTASNKYGSLGVGIPLTLGVGYKFTPHVAFQIHGTYLLGSRVETARFEVNSGSQTFVSTQEAYTRQIQLSPALVIHPFQDGAMISPYVRFGAVIPVSGATYGERRGDLAADPDFGTLTIFNEFSDPGLQAEGDATINGAFSLGFNAALGLDYNVNPQLAVFVEASYVGLRIRRATYQVDRAEIIGVVAGTDGVYPVVDVLNDLPPTLRPDYSSYIEYRDELTGAEVAAAVAEGNYGTEENPSLELRTDANMNALRFNIGVRYGLFE